MKEVDEMSVPEPLKSSEENVDKLLSHDNSKSDAPVVQTSVVQISSPPVHQAIEIGTSPAQQNSPWRGWTVPYQALSNPEQISTPATQNSPWRGSTAPNQVPSDWKQISTPVSQNSPWRGWTVPDQAVSPRPSLPGTSLKPHPR